MTQRCSSFVDPYKDRGREGRRWRIRQGAKRVLLRRRRVHQWSSQPSNCCTWKRPQVWLTRALLEAGRKAFIGPKSGFRLARTRQVRMPPARGRSGGPLRGLHIQKISLLGAGVDSFHPSNWDTKPKNTVLSELWGKKREVTQWLCDGRDQGRPEHTLVLQETAWKFDMNCTTSSATTRGPRWHVLRSGSGTPEGGVMFFFLTTLFSTEQIRSAVLHAGRLFHVRIMMDPPLDVIGTYQHTWNVQKKPLQEDPAEQPGGSKTEQLLQRRRKIWKQLRTWISGIPRRNGCIIMGDFNTLVLPVPALVGEGLAKTWSPCCSNRSLSTSAATQYTRLLCA